SRPVRRSRRGVFKEAKVTRMSFLASRTRSAPEGVGKAVRRREDPRLVTGAGCYTDDVNLPGQAYASMVRSPHAHARIVRIDTAPALATPGVLAVLTGADLVADGLKAISHRPVPTNPHEVPLKSPDGSPFFVSEPLPLPVDRARFVGEPVAMVVAETALAARAGAERVTVEWEPLPAVVTSTDAIAAGAVAVWDACASNVAVETEAGDATATDAAFARAAHVVTLDSRINRVTGVPMEPRAAVGDFDASTGRYTVYAGSGGSWRIRNDVAVVLGVPPESVLLIAPPVARRSCTSSNGSSISPRDGTASTGSRCGGRTWCRRARCRIATPWVSSTTAATTPPPWIVWSSCRTGRDSSPVGRMRAGEDGTAVSASRTTSS